jgi:hypothetical protein
MRTAAVLVLVTLRLSLEEAACRHCESTRLCVPSFHQVTVCPASSLRSTITACLCRVRGACLQPPITLSYTSTTAGEPPPYGSHWCRCAVDGVARQCSWGACLGHAPCDRLGCPSGRRGPHRCCSAGCTRGAVHRHPRQHVEQWRDRLAGPHHRQ